MTAMTEREWHLCGDPRHLLAYLDPKRHGRKELLFYAACCRRAWHLLDGSGRAAVAGVEGYAERTSSKTQAEARLEAAASSAGLDRLPAQRHAALATSGLFQRRAAIEAALAAGDGDPRSQAYRAERKAQCGLVRDLFGNPFRPLAVDPTYLMPTAVSLAHAAYDERILPSGELEPARLAVLADALEEAGCTDADLLEHLRGPGPHVRGCWALDLLLGKQ
jgi:hypothetical protein